MVESEVNATQLQLLKLNAEKQKLEQKINEYGEVLKANGNVGMKDPLVDAEGYPRNDIDVHQVREARQRILCLLNDHKALMSGVEQLLHKLHAEAKASHQEQTKDITHRTAALALGEEEAATSTVTPSAPTTSAPTTPAAPAHPMKPITKVDLVSPGSPAEKADLRVGDEILEFGSINSGNFDNLLSILGLVRNMQNRRVPLRVKRGAEELQLTIIPGVWSGRGLLGCNMILAGSEED